MSEHTGGKWSADTIANLEVGSSGDSRDYTCYVLSEYQRGVSVARANGATSDEALGNARLISASQGLLDGLLHMQWCRSCAEGGWEDCEGGRAAKSAILKATECPIAARNEINMESPISREWLTGVENRLGWGGSATWPVPQHVLLWARAAERLLLERDNWRQVADRLYDASKNDTSCADWNKVYAEYESCGG